MKTELLAPAGSIEGLKAVIAAGADAVYIGGTKFGARAYADNPDEDDLLDAIDYAHLRGVKVYMTVNTLLKDNEIKELPAYLAPYVERGLDAVLVQDFGVLALLSRTFPDLPLHASTQMTVTGPFGASLLKEYGVVRVVPARELSLRELSRIRRESGLE
ncbi:MAG: peptidase U32 family protein, partial [Lachnospiraceae bacterium]|nr:peptidase U32 family protein [Lachnospiraceae bacterium]